MKLLLLLIPALLLSACASNPKVYRDEYGNEIPEPFELVGGMPMATDIARFLAGRPVRQGAQISRLQKTAEYQGFSRDTLSKWKYRTAVRISKQNEWSAGHIEPLIGSPHTVVYPFGGPDLLYAVAMFPESQRYLLMGLEPVGVMPDLEHADPAAVVAALRGHNRAVETQLLHGYFITKDMKTDFSNGVWQGVTPVLLTALGLMEATDLDVRPVNAGGNQAVEIRFSLSGWGRKSVVYVSGDLSNRGFPGAYESWLSKEAGGGSVAYFKAASYLMQDSGFTAIRDWVLGRSRAVVQDDSGIPYRALDPQVWDLHLFGSYDGPIDFFVKHRQADLATAYQVAGPRVPLSFGSGYQMNPHRANLTIARRR